MLSIHAEKSEIILINLNIVIYAVDIQEGSRVAPAFNQL